MTAGQEIISALVAGGMDAIDAAALLARAGVEMVAPMSSKSVGALRQQRYRERNKSVTKRNDSITSVTRNEASQNVTERNESVTALRPDENAHISYLPSKEDNLSEKKESKEVRKKDRAAKKRNAPLRDDWAPSVHAYKVAEEHGVSLQIVEQIFRDYLKSSGKLYADYDAAFYNFLRNQRRFNGNVNHAKAENPRSGSIIAALDRALERSIAEDADLAAPANNLLSFSGRSV